MSDTTIITFVDFKYLPIFNVFYKYFKKLNLNNLLVISLDIEAFNNLRTRKINTVYKPYKINGRDKFWEFRLNVINEIFTTTKKSIIHTDSDCFWLKNIVSEIDKIKDDYDIIGSIAFGWPKNIVNKMGFVLCCGFYYIKYTSQNASFFNNIKRLKIGSIDDQVLFNNYLYNNKSTIIDNNLDNIIYKTIVLTDNTKVGIIKDTVISRKDNTELYCFHPTIGAKTIPEKMLQIKKYKSLNNP
jgi:hypothetical protein